MAQWHLDELRAALERRGWRLVQELPTHNRMSGTWVLTRSGQSHPLVLDFDGLDDLEILPMQESYACSARGTDHSIYFGRRGVKGSIKREHWKTELLAFVKAVGGDDAA